MAPPHNPRHGSMQFWPHVRAKRMYAKVRSWKQTNETKLLGFMGYKVGMTHLLQEKVDVHSKAKKVIQVVTPVTIIECPPILPHSIRFYKNTVYGLKLISEVLAPKHEKELKRKTVISKNKKDIPEKYDDVRLVVYTQPKKTGTPNKKPEIIEIGIGGKTAQDKLEYAKSLLDKEIKVSDLFKVGQVVDTRSVTKGKGFQGPVKIAGVKIRQAKSEKTKRGPGSLGGWKAQGLSLYRVAHARKHGLHQRTEHNKIVVKLGDNPEDINVKGGFSRYGLVKNEYILLQGSVAGPTKRPILLTEPIRQNSKYKAKEPKITFISLESQQRR